MSKRSSRTSRAQKLDSLMEELDSLRRTGKSATELIEGDKVDNVYDVVSEEKYREIVARRREAGDFIIDDLGGRGGYVDNGEETWMQGGGDDKAAVRKQGRKDAREKEESKKPTQKINKAFIQQQRYGQGGTAVDEIGQDEFVQDLFQELEAGAKETITGLRRSEYEGRDTAGDQHASPAKKRRVGGAAVLSGPAPRKEYEIDFDLNFNDLDLSSDDEAEQKVPAGEQKENGVVVPKSNAVVQATESSIRQATKAREEALAVQDTRFDAGEAVDQPISGVAFDATMLDGSKDKNNPLVGGRLLMYWYEACEDRRNPDRVYLFGQVMLPNRRTASCCLQVGGLERSVFVLPRRYHYRPNAPAGEETTQKPVQDMEVMREMAQVLRQNGIPKFRIGKAPDQKYCFHNDPLFRYADRTAEELESDPELQSLQDPERLIPGQPTNYLQVQYSYKHQPVRRDLRGQTFSHVFNARAKIMERFLISRKMKGPGWVQISGVRPAHQRRTRCAFEFQVDSPDTLQVLVASRGAPLPPSPALRTAVVSVRTRLKDPKRPNSHELLSVCVLTHQGVNPDGPTRDPYRVQRRMFVRPLVDSPLHMLRVPKNTSGLTVCSSERELLAALKLFLQQQDPDVLVGHELHTVIDLLQDAVSRMQSSAVQHRSNGVAAGFIIGQLGRIVCDTKVSARELMIGERQYSLPFLAKKMSFEQPVPGPSFRLFGNPKEEMEAPEAYLVQCVYECTLTLRLMTKLVVLPLTKQLTSLCGNLWNRSLQSLRADRIEHLLLHEFTSQGYIPPEKFARQEREQKADFLEKQLARKHAKEAGLDEAEMKQQEDMGGAGGLGGGGGGPGSSLGSKKKGKRRGKPEYSGGLVLEPKRGFYDKYVLLLDFNSLYPSIIREYNICFTTVPHWQVAPGRPTVAKLPPSEAQHGLLPTIMTRLLERRKQVKRLLKTETDPVKKKQFDIKQKALKLVANSMYGCLGFKNSRFYCQPMAALITSQGRDLLQKTVELAEKCGYPVIYGDTDSIMVFTNSTDFQEVLQIGRRVKSEVNKLHRVLEIEIDGVYKKMLLLRKKKYAAITISMDPRTGQPVEAREIKGLDLVRRDWCGLSKAVSRYVLDQIMNSEQGRETVVENIHAHLRQIAADVRRGLVPMQQFVMTKSLSRLPHEYADPRQHPHVTVALQMLKEGKRVRVDDVIEYVVCAAPYHQSGQTPAPHSKSVADRVLGPGHVAPVYERMGAFVKKQGGGEIDRESGGDSNPLRDPRLPDFEWYLERQVLPPVVRLCAPIEETDQARIADCLGLDSSKFHAYSGAGAEEDQDDLFDSGAFADDNERFKHCAVLKLTCPQCHISEPFAGPLRWKGAPGPQFDARHNPHAASLSAEQCSSGLRCSTRDCPGLLQASSRDGGQKPLRAQVLRRAVSALCNSLDEVIHQHVSSFYRVPMRCDDTSCGYQTFDLLGGQTHNNCLMPDCSGKLVPRVDATHLHTQLMYYRWLFDTRRARFNVEKENKRRAAGKKAGTCSLPPLLANTTLDRASEQVLDEVRKHVDRRLAQCAHHFVQLGPLFGVGA